MPYEHKENTGTLFQNDRKTTDNQPDFKGQINVGGKLLDIAGWMKEGGRGNFYSLKVSEPRQQQPAQQNAPQQQQAYRKAGAKSDQFDKFMENSF